MWMIIIRVAVMTLLLMLAIIVGYSASFSFPFLPFLYVVGASYAASGLALPFYLSGKHLTAQAYAHCVVDLVLVTALVYTWGGISNPAYILYLLVVIEAGLVISGKASYLAASLAAILFGLIVDGMYFGLIPIPASSGPESRSFGSVLYTIAVAWSAFFIVAFLTSTLSSRFRKTREALAAARKELAVRERLAEAGRVSAVLAHEIRNPLAAIYGSVQVLQARMRPDDEQKELMDIILRESQRVSKTLDQFLDYAIPVNSTFTRVRLSDIVAETIKLLAAGGELDRSIEIQGNFRDSAITVRASAGQMRQLFMNIIKNALKAMAGPGGRLTIDVERTASGRAVIDISDTGIGISSEDLEHLFDPFFSRFEGGRGLGMSIVRRIVDDYGGLVEVTSEQGKGTLVRITLPMD